MHLTLAPNCLAVFIDDTGHELLLGDHVTYGLGGCAVLAQEYEKVIRDPWRSIRQAINGDPDLPLHAVRFGHTSSSKQKDLVADFFARSAFSRLGVVTTIQTVLPDPTTLPQGTPAQAFFVIESLKHRIVNIAKWKPFESMAIIFEDNPRSNTYIKRYFGNFEVQVDGKPAQVECFFMPKSKRTRFGDLLISSRTLRAAKGVGQRWASAKASTKISKRSFIALMNVWRTTLPLSELRRIPHPLIEHPVMAQRRLKQA